MESIVKAHSFLKRISGENAGKVYPLFSSLSVIGRGNHNTITLPDAFLSRKHCSIRYEDSNWIITDYGALNGTYINGQRMESSSYSVLEDKTIIFLGDPQESTCGFIFLTSPPVSQQTEPTRNEAMGPSSLASISEPGPSTSNSGQTSSNLMEWSPNPPPNSPIPTPDSSNPPPDQSDDVSSTRCVRDVHRSGELHRHRSRHSLARERAGTSINSLRLHPMGRIYRERHRRRLIRRRESSGSDFNGRTFNYSNIGSSASNIARHTDYLPYAIPSIPPLSSFLPNYPFTVTNEEVVPFNRETSPSNRETASDGAQNQRVPAIDVSNMSENSPSHQRMSGEVASRRRNTSEFPMLDVLVVDSVPSDCESDCSISSMDSLGTRIRKQKVRSNQILSDSRIESQKNSPNSKGPSLNDPSDEFISHKKLKLDEFEEDSLTCLDSESLICKMEDSVKDCSAKLENDTWMSATTSDESDALQYLKERVLKLQKNVMEAAEELKKAHEKNKEQQTIIQELQNTQGISREQLCEDLENELSCNICTEVLIKPIILDCGHIFCKYCISIWKKKKRQCPNCRDPIRTEKEVKVLDNFIIKTIDHLEPMYRMKRNELIQARSAETAKLKKSSRKRTTPARLAVWEPPQPGIPNAVELRVPGLRVQGPLGTESLTRDRIRLRPLGARGIADRSEIVRELNPLIRRLVGRIENTLATS